MDANFKALQHVQNALLHALCATHPNPQALNLAFAYYLERVQDILRDPEVRNQAVLWARTFCLHIPDRSVPDKGEPDHPG